MQIEVIKQSPPPIRIGGGVPFLDRRKKASGI